MTHWVSWAENEAQTIKAAGQWRTVRDLDGRGPTFSLGDETVVSFASNDYLGLSQHRGVVAAAHDALDRYGSGSGSARLIVGARRLHTELEAALAEWKRQDRAVLFSTGFMANLGVMSVFAGTGVTVFSDALNHASIIDGCRLGKAAVHIYPHNDLEYLDRALSRANAGRAVAGRAIVVSDTVFSMDGDVADLAALHAVADRHGALLVLDEAHALLGPELAADAPNVLRVGTLSKTLGSLGGFVTGPAPMIELLINKARSFIFTTAATPADTGAALAARRVLCSDEGTALLVRLRKGVEQLRPGHPSPIISIVLGDEIRALRASEDLRMSGLLVPAIRPPTVPSGTSRLRITVSAAHADEDIERLRCALAHLTV